MDTLKKILLKRIESSTLIEVITALIIISTVFSLAIMIYLNVQRAGASSRRLACDMLMEEVYAGTLQEKKFNSGEFEFENITVYQDVQNANGTVRIHLKARDADGKMIAEQKHLVYVAER